MKTMNKLLIMATMLLTSSVAFAQGPTIGIIDLEQALFGSEAAQQLEANTREEFGADEQRLERLNTELREIIERAQRDESILSEAEMRDMNSDAEEKQAQADAKAAGGGKAGAPTLMDELCEKILTAALRCLGGHAAADPKYGSRLMLRA